MTPKPITQSGAAAAVAEKTTTMAAEGIEATEEQARAIIATAKKAVEVAKTKTRADGAGSVAGEPSSTSSLKRSLECFLEGRRKNKATSSSAATRRRHLETSTASLSSSSSN